MAPTKPFILSIMKLTSATSWQNELINQLTEFFSYDRTSGLSEKKMLIKSWERACAGTHRLKAQACALAHMGCLNEPVR